MQSSPSFRRGVRDGLVILVPVGFFAMAFGVVAVDAGIDRWLVVASSLAVLSGAAQFAMVGLLAAGPAAVLFAVTGLALRHLPMSAALSGVVGDRPLATRLRLAWVLVDETFGMTMRAAAAGVEDVAAYKGGADLVLASTWLVGTVVGVVAGPAIDPESLGVGVLFPLLFLALAFPLLRSRRDVGVAAVAVVATIVATLVLPPAWQVTVAAGTAAALGMWFDG